MEKSKQLFQYLSYLQYPLILLALYFCCRPIIFGYETGLEDINNALVLTGLGISFSTLQDHTKTQNKASQRVYENPRYSRYFIIYLLILTLGFIGFGIFGYFFSTNEKVKEISFGIIVLGIGMIGFVKVALEMAAYHTTKNQVKNI